MATAVEIETKPVTMTEAATAHVRKQMTKRGAGTGVRLGVKKVGCSGLAYVVDYVDEPAADDHIYPVEDGLAIVVSPAHYDYVKGTRLDFKRRGINEEFVFDNPNAKDSCGCGESFSV